MKSRRGSLTLLKFLISYCRIFFSDIYTQNYMRGDQIKAMTKVIKFQCILHLGWTVGGVTLNIVLKTNSLYIEKSIF